jgi:hypothetical protein
MLGKKAANAIGIGKRTLKIEIESPTLLGRELQSASLYTNAKPMKRELGFESVTQSHLNIFKCVVQLFT